MKKIALIVAALTMGGVAQAQTIAGYRLGEPMASTKHRLAERYELRPVPNGGTRLESYWIRNESGRPVGILSGCDGVVTGVSVAFTTYADFTRQLRLKVQEFGLPTISFEVLQADAGEAVIEEMRYLWPRQRFSMAYPTDHIPQ